jgi:hypothetical protein
MAALAEVLPYDFVFMSCEELIEGPADESQREIIGSPAVPKDLDLDLDWEAPRGGDWRIGMGQAES